jgi:hypothetical protein
MESADIFSRNIVIASTGEGVCVRLVSPRVTMDWVMELIRVKLKRIDGQRRLHRLVCSLARYSPTGEYIQLLPLSFTAVRIVSA